MRSLDEVLNQFAYHAAAVVELWELIPDGPEKTMAFRRLQERGIHAHLAIALEVPADTSDSRSVAQVLPREVGDGSDPVLAVADAMRGRARAQTPAQAESGLAGGATFEDAELGGEG